MAELRKLFYSLGFGAVQTYIQSGNAVFSSSLDDTSELAMTIGRAIFSHFGFEVPVMVLEQSNFSAIIRRNPYSDEKLFDHRNLYFTFLWDSPAQERIKKLGAESFKDETCTVTENCVYLLCKKGIGNSKLNNNLIELRLRVPATTRNYRTVLKLHAMMASQ